MWVDGRDNVFALLLSPVGYPLRHIRPRASVLYIILKFATALATRRSAILSVDIFLLWWKTFLDLD